MNSQTALHASSGETVGDKPRRDSNEYTRVSKKGSSSALSAIRIDSCARTPPVQIYHSHALGSIAYIAAPPPSFPIFPAPHSSSCTQALANLESLSRNLVSCRKDAGGIDQYTSRNTPLSDLYISPQAAEMRMDLGDGEWVN